MGFVTSRSATAAPRRWWFRRQVFISRHYQHSILRIDTWLFIHRWGWTSVNKNVVYGALQAQPRTDEWSVPNSCVWCGFSMIWVVLPNWKPLIEIVWIDNKTFPPTSDISSIFSQVELETKVVRHWTYFYPSAWPFRMPGQPPEWNRATQAEVR